MTYKDLGYSKLLYKRMYEIGNAELTEDVSSQRIPILTGSSITGGITKSPDGKMYIDWDKTQIVMGDGAYNRVFIGIPE